MGKGGAREREREREREAPMADEVRPTAVGTSAAHRRPLWPGRLQRGSVRHLPRRDALTAAERGASESAPTRQTNGRPKIGDQAQAPVAEVPLATTRTGPSRGTPRESDAGSGGIEEHRCHEGEEAEDGGDI